MLTTYTTSENVGTSDAPHTVSWIDLLHPTNEERASVEGGYGLKLPSREELSQVELSSRLAERNGVLFLSMPTVSHLSGLDQAQSPLGFVLSKKLLVTIRYAQLHAFETVAAKRSTDGGSFSSVETFAALVDGMLELSADVIEQIAAELDGVSRAVFSTLGKQKHVTQSNDELRRVLIGVGTAGERLSRIRDSVLGLQRIIPFVAGTEQDWIPANIRARLKTTQNDLSSLTEYETHLSNKVQFLLARAGFHQHQAERYFPGIDGDFHRGNSANARGKHLRNEFQEHAGTELGVGIPLWPRIDLIERYPANRVVQVAKVGVGGIAWTRRS